jgi:hypothetical protein
MIICDTAKKPPPSSALPADKRRPGRPPKPGGPTPQAEVQRAYRARLAAAGKAVGVVALKELAMLRQHWQNAVRAMSSQIQRRLGQTYSRLPSLLHPPHAEPVRGVRAAYRSGPAASRHRVHGQARSPMPGGVWSFGVGDRVIPRCAQEPGPAVPPRGSPPRFAQPRLPPKMSAEPQSELSSPPASQGRGTLQATASSSI